MLEYFNFFIRMKTKKNCIYIIVVKTLEDESFNFVPFLIVLYWKVINEIRR